MKTLLFVVAVLEVVGKWSFAPVIRPAEPASCRFGENFYEVSDVEGLYLSPEEWIVEVDALQTPREQEQLRLAVQQSSQPRVRSVADALLRVDDHVVRRVWLLDEDDTVQYVIYEYGAAGHSYAAFFAPSGRELLARAYDGDILDCRVLE